AHSGPRWVDDAIAFGARLAQDELRLTIGLLADLRAQLLRGHQRIVQRLVPVAIGAQLLDRRLVLAIQLVVEADQPLQLLGHPRAEFLHPHGLVAAELSAKLLRPYVDGRQAEAFIYHVALAPKRTVPSRTMVAPSSSAIS